VSIPSFHWWRTVFFLIPAIGTYTIALGAVSVASSLFDRTGRFAHACARLWSRLILVTTGVRVRVEGLDVLEPGRTYIFVSNHQSIYDIPVIFWWLPYQLRIIAKESLGSFPFIGWHLRRTGHLLVDRRNPDRAGILRRWRDLVVKGLSLIIFPEGTRSTDGRVGRFKAGSFMLAIEAGLPVVPLSIVGTRFVMRKGRLAVAPGNVTLAVHPPIDTAGRAEPPTIDDARALAAKVHDVISRRVEAIERARGTWPSP
jgi:1-acyl-sn-glycerol-3-phosphate acyltransferase